MNDIQKKSLKDAAKQAAEIRQSIADLETRRKQAPVKRAPMTVIPLYAYRKRPVSYALIATRLLHAIGGRAKNRHQFGLCYITSGGNVPIMAYEGVARAIAHGQIIMNDDGSIELSSVAKEFMKD